MESKPPFQFGLWNWFVFMAVVAASLGACLAFPSLGHLVGPFIPLAILAWIVEWDARRFG
jgi:hypothetical protein